MRKSRSSRRRRKLDKRNKRRIQSLLKKEGTSTENVVKIEVTKVTYDTRPYNHRDPGPNATISDTKVKVRLKKHNDRMYIPAKAYTYTHHILVLKEKLNDKK